MSYSLDIAGVRWDFTYEGKLGIYQSDLYVGTGGHAEEFSPPSDNQRKQSRGRYQAQEWSVFRFASYTTFLPLIPSATARNACMHAPRPRTSSLLVSLIDWSGA